MISNRKLWELSRPRRLRMAIMIEAILMRDPRYSWLARSFASAMLAVVFSGCSKPPNRSEYANALDLVAKRQGSELHLQLSLPQRANGYSETYMVFVAPKGQEFGRYLQSETSRSRETSNLRSIRTELTDRDRSIDLDIRVRFSVWKHLGPHNDKKLFEGTKVFTVPR